jgi:hypothetical protein
MEDSDRIKGGDNRESDIVFYKTVNAGKRIYYLDVKKNKKGELFLAITESKKVYKDDNSQQALFEKHKIFLYKEDFNKFVNALDESLSYIKENNTVDFVPSERNSFVLDEIDLKIDF